MNYNFGEHFNGFISQQISAGFYNDENEIICDALELLEKRIEFLKLRDDVKKGISSSSYILAEDLFEKLTAKYQQKITGVE